MKIHATIQNAATGELNKKKQKKFSIKLCVQESVHVLLSEHDRIFKT
jgi:hypothetical protein